MPISQNLNITTKPDRKDKSDRIWETSIIGQNIINYQVNWEEGSVGFEDGCWDQRNLQWKKLV